MTSDDLVHQLGDKSVYHVRCFACIHCQRRLSSKALYVTDHDRRVVCKDCCLPGIIIYALNYQIVFFATTNIFSRRAHTCCRFL